jgi:hypothetical protein
MLRFMLRILKMSGKYKTSIVIAAFISFIKAILMKVPIIMTVIFLEAVYNKSLDNAFCISCLIILAIALVLQYIAQNAADRLQASSGYKICADYRLRLGEHLRKLPMGYFTEGNMGKISSVLSTDIVFIEESSMNVMADLINYLFASLVMVGFMFIFNIKVGITTLICSVIIYIYGTYMRKSSMADSYLRQEKSEELTESVLNFVSGIGIIKSYNMLDESSEKLSAVFDDSCKMSLKFEANFSPLAIGLKILYAFATCIVLLAATKVYMAGDISLVYYIGILLFIIDLFIPLRTFFEQILRLTVMESCLDRMEEIFEESELTDEALHTLNDTVENAKELQFEAVHFAYDKKEVLHGITFDVNKNTMTALAGPSGGGKSTIASLISRFWDVTSGRILIRGRDIRKVSLSELMSNISMVFQRVYLFQDTVYNNIAMGRPEASQEEVIAAAKKARCYEFISKLENGFDTVIGEGGATLSGGERQRISIARCILKDAPIVILDEATASIDADNERLIQEAISELCKGKTLMVIAHRLNTIKDADQILLVSEGHIAERGTHKELMDMNGIYRRFVELRLRDRGWSRV